MGLTQSTLDTRVLIAGLDSAGKTTVLLKLHRGEKRKDERVSTIPTMDFNVMQWKYKRKTFSVWDVGGQDAIRPLWRHHYIGTQGLVYVVDSNDVHRVAKASEELHKIMLDHAMRDACLLVYANKTDLPQALTVDQVRDQLQLEDRERHAAGQRVEQAGRTRGGSAQVDGSHRISSGLTGPAARR